MNARFNRDSRGRNLSGSQNFGPCTTEKDTTQQQQKPKLTLFRKGTRPRQYECEYNSPTQNNNNFSSTRSTNSDSDSAPEEIEPGYRNQIQRTRTERSNKMHTTTVISPLDPPISSDSQLTAEKFEPKWREWEIEKLIFSNFKYNHTNWDEKVLLDQLNRVIFPKIDAYFNVKIEAQFKRLESEIAQRLKNAYKNNKDNAQKIISDIDKIAINHQKVINNILLNRTREQQRAVKRIVPPWPILKSLMKGVTQAQRGGYLQKQRWLFEQAEQNQEMQQATNHAEVQKRILQIKNTHRSNVRNHLYNNANQPTTDTTTNNTHRPRPIAIPVPPSQRSLLSTDESARVNNNKEKEETLSSGQKPIGKSTPQQRPTTPESPVRPPHTTKKLDEDDSNGWNRVPVLRRALTLLDRFSDEDRDINDILRNDLPIILLDTIWDELQLNLKRLREQHESARRESAWCKQVSAQVHDDDSKWKRKIVELEEKRKSLQREILKDEDTLSRVQKKIDHRIEKNILVTSLLEMWERARDFEIDAKWLPQDNPDKAKEIAAAWAEKLLSVKQLINNSETALDNLQTQEQRRLKDHLQIIASDHQDYLQIVANDHLEKIKEELTYWNHTFSQLKEMALDAFKRPIEDAYPETTISSVEKRLFNTLFRI